MPYLGISWPLLPTEGEERQSDILMPITSTFVAFTRLSETPAVPPGIATHNNVMQTLPPAANTC